MALCRPLLVVVLFIHLLVVSSTKVEQSPLVITRRVVLTGLLDSDECKSVQTRDFVILVGVFVPD